MIKAHQLAQQMINFQKVSFFSCYDAAAKMQNQASSAVDKMLAQAIWIPKEGRQAISNWTDIYQEERNRFKTYVEKSFTNFEKCFAEETIATPAKSKKTSTAKVKQAASIEPKETASIGKKKAAPVEVKKTVTAVPKKATPIEVKKPAAAEPKKEVFTKTKKALPAKVEKVVLAEEKKANPVAAKKPGASGVKGVTV